MTYCTPVERDEMNMACADFFAALDAETPGIRAYTEFLLSDDDEFLYTPEGD